ncbi:helix-turn-helix domain-containing protein [Actinomadura scrupuli]|uniref:helix-turn-helix domain-containing protein n=1 Tax=Actinomadura scrupuli TaxID=559629 RepID=UPI003D97D0CF
MAKVNTLLDGTLNAVPATIRGLRLASELRDLREAATLSMREAATRIDVTERTIQRIEGAQTVPREALLRRMLAVYNADSTKTGALLELRREAKIGGWWVDYDDVRTGIYVELEENARKVRSYQGTAVPALLQTEEYAAAAVSAVLGDRPDNARILELRSERRTRFNRRAQELHVILDEAVLRRAVGGPEVMLNQVGYVAKMAQLPHITVQVVPFTVGAHVGMAGSFVLMDFEDAQYPQVIYVETRAGDLYPTGKVIESGFNIDWRALTQLALSPKDTAAFLAELIKEWSGGTGT